MEIRRAAHARVAVFADFDHSAQQRRVVFVGEVVVAIAILIGILVAVIIMITLWFKPFGITSAEVLIKPAKQVAAPAVKLAIEQTTFFVNNLLH